MQLIQIDALKLQTLETFIDTLLEIFRPTIWHPLVRAGPSVAAFRRDDEPFGIRIKRFCDKQFISFGSISIRRIDQVCTELDGASQNFERILAIRRPTPYPLACQPHRAKSKSINRQISTDAETGVIVRRCSREERRRSARQKRRSACERCTKKQAAAHATANSIVVY